MHFPNWTQRNFKVFLEIDKSKLYENFYENYIKCPMIFILWNNMTIWCFYVIWKSENMTQINLLCFINRKSDKYSSSSSNSKLKLLSSSACSNIKNSSPSKTRPHQMPGLAKALPFFLNQSWRHQRHEWFLQPSLWSQYWKFKITKQ